MNELEKLQGTSSTLHQTLCIISNSSVNSNWSYCRETLNLGQNRRFFVPCDLEFWWITLKSSRAPLLCCFKLCASFYSHRWIKKTCSPETLNSGQNRRSIALCDLEIWQMTLKNNMASLLCCFKLCASFHSHRWIQTKVTVWKRSIRVKIGVLSRVTLTFDRWLWKTIGDLFSATSKPSASFHSCTCPAPRVRKGGHNQGDTAWSVWEGHRTVEEDNTWKEGVAVSDREMCQRGWEGFCNPSQGQYQSWDPGGAIAEGYAQGMPRRNADNQQHHGRGPEWQ